MNTQEINTRRAPRAKRVLNWRETRRALLEVAETWGATRKRLPRGTLEAMEADARKLVALYAAQMQTARAAEGKAARHKTQDSKTQEAEN